MVDAICMHMVTGMCDICGHTCDSATDELNALTCTFAQCDSLVYHQDCLEKFLKSIKCEKNRKTGFQCPRGRGKGPSCEPCPGRIDKSHPIHPRNDGNKKRKKGKAPEAAQPAPPRFGPAAKALRQKEKEIQDKQRLLVAKEEAAAAKKLAAGKALIGPARQNKNAPAVDLNKQRAQAEALRREMGMGTAAPPVEAAAPNPGREYKTLDEYEASKGAAAAQAANAAPAGRVTNAWVRAAPVEHHQQQQQHRKEPQVALTPAAFPAMPPAAKAVSKASLAPLPSQPPQQLSFSAWGANGAAANEGSSDDNDAAVPTWGATAQASQAVAPGTRPAPSQPAAQQQQQHQALQQYQAQQQQQDVVQNDAGSGLGLPPPGSVPQPIAARLAAQMPRLSLASSFSSQLSDASLQSSLMPDAVANGGGAVGVLPVGAVYVDLDGDCKLTKAQKKNLKRAEKKARQVGGGNVGERAVDAGPGGSRDCSGPGLALTGITESPALPACLEALAQYKALCCLHALTNMGFIQWHCIAAMQRSGTDVPAACDWLMEHVDSIGANVLLYDGPTLPVDVSTEMAAIEEALALLPCSAHELHACVAACGGHLHDALTQVLDRLVPSRDASLNGYPPAELAWGSCEGDDIPEAALMAFESVMC